MIFEKFSVIETIRWASIIPITSAFPLHWNILEQPINTLVKVAHSIFIIIIHNFLAKLLTFNDKHIPLGGNVNTYNQIL
jgi:hypothetical protein